MIISIDAEKELDRIQHPFMILKIQQTRNRWEIPQNVKGIYEKPTTNPIPKSETLKAFSLK